MFDPPTSRICSPRRRVPKDPPSCCTLSFDLPPHCAQAGCAGQRQQADEPAERQWARRSRQSRCACRASALAPEPLVPTGRGAGSTCAVARGAGSGSTDALPCWPRHCAVPAVLASLGWRQAAAVWRSGRSTGSAAAAPFLYIRVVLCRRRCTDRTLGREDRLSGPLRDLLCLVLRIDELLADLLVREYQNWTAGVVPSLVSLNITTVSPLTCGRSPARTSTGPSALYCLSAAPARRFGTPCRRV